MVDSATRAHAGRDGEVPLKSACNDGQSETARRGVVRSLPDVCELMAQCREQDAEDTGAEEFHHRHSIFAAANDGFIFELARSGQPCKPIQGLLKRSKLDRRDGVRDLHRPEGPKTAMLE